MNLAWWLRTASIEHGDHAALIEPGTGAEHTYSELHARANRVAAVLRDHGVGEDDVVTTLMPDDDWHFTVFFATMQIGAVFSGLNRTLHLEKHRSDIDRLGSRVMVVSPQYLQRAEALREATGLETIIVSDLDWSGEHPLLQAEIEAVTPFDRIVPRTEEQLCAVNFTGGTSGLSKGVMFTHGKLGLSARMSIMFSDMRSTDRNLSVISLFHSGGIADAVRWTMIGGTNILTGSWNSDNFVQAIENYQPTFIAAIVPTMVRDFMRHPRFDSLDLRGMRATLGGETVAFGMREALRDRGMRITTNYGLTETMPWSVFGTPFVWNDETDCPTGAVGKPFPELCEVILKDPASGVEVTTSGVTGEVCIRGGVVFPGYYNDPATTAASFDENGWFHTRDMAYFDDDGWYYIRGRVDDIINCGGEKVSLIEIENLLKASPDVADVACIGVEHERFGLVPAAVVTGASDLPEDELVARLDAYLIENFERWKRPRLYAVRSEVPRTQPKRSKDIVAIRRLFGDVHLKDDGRVLTLTQLQSETT